ncbi:hypothetical protein [Bacillus sp. FJAT-29814]|uniref:hypothetical protein n=1 Tax=Bacillus sp. FJAT-29814 TaxID=1729688 RepID=UPI00082B97BF|nr:hypothetical protein [Bacillus sp. FJAT-29814]
MYKTIVSLLCWTAILSGILLITAHLLNYGSMEYGTVFGNLLIFTAHALLVFTFFAVYMFQGERNGLTGLLAMIFGVAGNIIVTAIVFVEIAQASLGDVGEVFSSPAIQPIYIFGPLLFVIGMILLGISLIRGKILPAYSGYFLLAGTIIFALASVFPGFQSMIEIVGSLFTGAGFIIIGIQAAKRPAASNKTDAIF